MHLFFWKEQNESINRLRRVGLSGFRGRTGFHELRRRMNALNHKGVLIKCIKVIGEKRESRR
jgi:hypothetical protein